MKATKIWIARHENESDNFDVRFNEPNCGTYLYSNFEGGEDNFVEYKEYALIELE